MNNVKPVQTTSLWHGQTRDELERKIEARQESRSSSVGNEAAVAVSEMQDVAMQDTMEDMSLVLGNRLKGKSRQPFGGDDEKIHRDEMLSSLAEQVAGDKLDSMLAGLQRSGIQDDLLNLYRQGEMNFSDAALLLAAGASALPLGSKRRKQLSSQLDELLAEQEDWALLMFADLELGSVNQNALQAMQQIVRQHHKPDQEENPEGLWQWFNKIKDWTDRSRRIRVLLRTFAFELSSAQTNEVTARLVTTLLDLKKLLVFLGLEDTARRLANVALIPQDEALSEVLLLIEQRWMYTEWLGNRLQQLKIQESKQVLYLIRLNEIVKFLPDICFLDVQQRKQISETIEEYIYQLS